MQLFTFKARSLAEAMRLVRDELGPHASLLHTRELGSPLARWFGATTIEVTASAEVEVPSRLPARTEEPAGRVLKSIPTAELQDYRRKFREDMRSLDANDVSLVERMAQNSNRRRS